VSGDDDMWAHRVEVVEDLGDEGLEERSIEVEAA
jgi:hypothetical protein